MNTSQAVIIILLVFNLAATIWFGIESNTSVRSPQVDNSSLHVLPEYIDDVLLTKLYDDFEISFNAKDYDAIFDLLGEAAKAQLTEENVKLELEKLTQYFKSVSNGAYTYSKLSANQGSLKVYDLYYAVNFPEYGAMSKKGSLKITLAVQGKTWQVYGYRLDTQ